MTSHFLPEVNQVNWASWEEDCCSCWRLLNIIRHNIYSHTSRRVSYLFPLCVGIKLFYADNEVASILPAHSGQTLIPAKIVAAIKRMARVCSSRQNHRSVKRMVCVQFPPKLLRRIIWRLVFFRCIFCSVFVQTLCTLRFKLLQNSRVVFVFPVFGYNYDVGTDQWRKHGLEIFLF